MIKFKNSRLGAGCARNERHINSQGTRRMCKLTVFKLAIRWKIDCNTGLLRGGSSVTDSKVESPPISINAEPERANNVSIHDGECCS